MVAWQNKKEVIIKINKIWGVTAHLVQKQSELSKLCFQTLVKLSQKMVEVDYEVLSARKLIDQQLKELPAELDDDRPSVTYYQAMLDLSTTKTAEFWVKDYTFGMP